MIYHNKYIWNKGDLVICVTPHTIISVVEKEKFGKRKSFIDENYIALALEQTPKSGDLAQVKIIYNNSVWWANSNYLRFYSINTNNNN